MSYTLLKTKQKTNIRTFEDMKKDEIESDEEESTEKYLLECITEIETLNKYLIEEKQKNEKNDDYIKIIEDEYKILGEKYKNINNDLKQLQEHKEISKMTDKNIKEKIKAKLGTIKETPYNKLSVDELRKISNERLKQLKKLNNIEY
jgi:hypothetical protein